MACLAPVFSPLILRQISLVIQAHRCSVGGGYPLATANAIGTSLYQNTAELSISAVGDVYAVRLRGTTEVMLLRILALKASISGGLGRVRFEYRSL